MTDQPTVTQVVDEIFAAREFMGGAPPPDGEGSAVFLQAIADLLADTLPLPGVDPVERARVALSLASVHGVDINDYAVSIARFRLTVEAMNKLGLRDVEAVPPEIGEIIRRNVVWADSLLPLDHPLQPYNRGGVSAPGGVR